MVPAKSLITAIPSALAVPSFDALLCITLRVHSVISQIYRHHSFGYEPQNLHRLDNQASSLTFCEHS